MCCRFGLRRAELRDSKDRGEAGPMRRRSNVPRTTIAPWRNARQFGGIGVATDRQQLAPGPQPVQEKPKHWRDDQRWQEQRRHESPPRITEGHKLLRNVVGTACSASARD